MSDTESRSPDHSEEEQQQQKQQDEKPAVSDTEVEPEASKPAVVEDSQPDPQGAAETSPKELSAEAEISPDDAEAGEKAKDVEEAVEKTQEAGEKAEEGGEKAEGGEDAKEPEAVEGEKADPEVEEEEEPIVINPDGNPHWLSTEDILAKGLPESEVENFRAFYFKHAHSLQSWYEVLREFALETEFITLSKEEIDALSAEGGMSEEEQETLNGLQARIDSAIELYNGDGALIKINDRSAKDAIMDRSDESFVQIVRDSVINSLEVEKQTVYAYSLWKDMGSHPGVLKRGMNKLKASFRRSRTGNAATARRHKLEEEKNEGEEGLAGETKKDDPKPETGEAPPQEGGDQDTGAKVTVEAQVEVADHGEEAEAATEPSADSGAKEEEGTGKEEEPPKEEASNEPAQEVEAKEDKPVQEEAAAAPSGDAPKEEESRKREEEGDVQEARQEDGKAKEGEESAAVCAEVTTDAEDSKDKKTKRKAATKNKPDEPRHKAAKDEPLDNQILRAFSRVMGTLYQVQDGQSAIKQLRSSVQIRNSLNSLKAFGGVEGVQVSMSVIRWSAQISDNRSMVFRGFVYDNELRALSQYDDTLYCPDVAHYKDSVICSKIQYFFQDSIKEPLAELKNYIIDFFVAPEKVYVVRMNPFATTVGACLFTWTDTRVLTKGPLQFSIVDKPRTAPDAFTSFQVPPQLFDAQVRTKDHYYKEKRSSVQDVILVPYTTPSRHAHFVSAYEALLKSSLYRTPPDILTCLCLRGIVEVLPIHNHISVESSSHSVLGSTSFRSMLA